MSLAHRCSQFSSVMFLRNKEHAELASLLHFHLRNRGIHIVEGFPCYMTDAHSDEDLGHVVRAFTESVESMVEAGIFGRRDRVPEDRFTAAASLLPLDRWFFCNALSFYRADSTMRVPAQRGPTADVVCGADESGSGGGQQRK